MALESALFRGNRDLQACAIKDPAHVLRGARGEHVAKIQFALFALDGAQIERSELAAQHYGPSTAAAVLRYKTKRAIINRTYQSKPDDIVGKMTIASLDKEMQKVEARPKPPGDCAIAPRGAPASSNVLARRGVSPLGVTTAGARNAKVAANPQLGGLVRIVVQITSRSAQESGYPLSAHIERARDCLFEHGITLSVEFGGGRGFADTLNFPDEVLSSAVSVADNIDQLRKASEDARPGLPGILRVIVCPMVAANVFGETFRNRRIGGRVVPPFVLLNSRLDDRSKATLIHEMIHASKNGVVPHDGDRASVFFENGTEQLGQVARTALPPQHAATLATMSARL